MKDAVHALKYGGLRPAAHGLGRMLAAAIAQLAAEAPAELLVVPVPLHGSKNARRGFNQARLLAVEALGFLRKSHPQWRLTLAASTLMRLRATESQAGLNPRERRRNVRGAFSVSAPAAVAERHVLIVDDILTTGATARAAAQALVQAGAASVWVATLARARRLNDSGRTGSSSRSFEPGRCIDPEDADNPRPPTRSAAVAEVRGLTGPEMPAASFRSPYMGQTNRPNPLDQPFS
jgi:ComF family protein